MRADPYNHGLICSPSIRQNKGGKVQATPGGEPPPCYYVADLYMETREEFEHLLATPEGQAAVADVPNYATGGVTFLYADVEEII